MNQIMIIDRARELVWDFGAGEEAEGGDANEVVVYMENLTGDTITEA
jgi:hypothetical protein